MLLTFFALSAGTILVIRRPLLDKALVLASTIPVALSCNILGITATGMLHELAGRELADLVFHDLAGWLMMPLAVVILLGELYLLARLLPEIAASEALPLLVSRPSPSAASSRPPKVRPKTARAVQAG